MFAALRNWMGAAPADGGRWVVLDAESSGLNPERDRLLSIAAVAADCGVHRAQLVRVTQRLVGCTPVALRQRARLGRGLARLSREPGLALSDVALAGGFADQAHFNRECQRWLGQAPGRWRRHWAEPGAEVRGPTS